MRDKPMLISEFIEMQNKQLSGTTYCDKRINRFMEKLEGVSFFEDRTYYVADLEKAWNESKSSNVYEDHGIQSI